MSYNAPRALTNIRNVYENRVVGAGKEYLFVFRDPRARFLDTGWIFSSLFINWQDYWCIMTEQIPVRACCKASGWGQKNARQSDTYPGCSFIHTCCPSGHFKRGPGNDATDIVACGYSCLIFKLFDYEQLRLALGHGRLLWLRFGKKKMVLEK